MLFLYHEFSAQVLFWFYYRAGAIIVLNINQNKKYIECQIFDLIFFGGMQQKD